MRFPLNLGGVGVGAQALATHTSDNVDEASVVLHALFRPEKKAQNTHTSREAKKIDKKISARL